MKHIFVINLLHQNDKFIRNRFRDGYFFKVNARVGNYLVASNWYEDIEDAKKDNRAFFHFTLQELKDESFKVYQEEEKEYSMDEVAKALGIDVKNLKIKKE